MRRIGSALCIAAVAWAGCTASPSGPGKPPPHKVAGRFTYSNLERALGGMPTAALGDCDGDGRAEAVFFNGSLLEWDEQGAITERQRAVPTWEGRVSAMRMLDLDGDGWQDLLAGWSGVVLFPGTGPCTWGPPRRFLSIDAGIVGQIQPTDVDHDGLTDLLVGIVEDPSMPMHLLRAVEPGLRYDDVPIPSPGLAPNKVDAPGKFQFYATLPSDVDGDGHLDVFALVDASESFFLRGTSSGALEVDPERTVFLARRSPMSISSLDYDRDGRIDYFVSNVALATEIHRSLGGGKWESVGERAGLYSPNAADWGSYAFDADDDGWTDLLVIRSESDGMYGPAQASLFLNQRDGTFDDAWETALPEGMFESRGLLCADLRGRGRPDCIVGDPKVGVRLLTNELVPTGAWAALRLEGTVSTPVPMGAIVTVPGSPPQTFAYAQQSPTTGHHDDELIFGLGETPSSRVHIAWPSGLEQEVALQPNRRATIREPRAWTLNTPVAGADGHSIVALKVDLTVLGTNEVKVELEGAGAFSAPPYRDGQTLIAQVRAPDAPGDARLKLTVNGRLLPARPTIRFR